VVKGHSRLSAMSLFDKSAYEFLLNYNRHSVSILYDFGDIATYLSIVADIHLSHPHLVPQLTPLEFHEDISIN